MRGFGSPHHESATSNLTRPDWGWGDVAPNTWNSTTADYGWGSARTFAFSPYLLSASQIGDDGGYRIIITGTFPRLSASPRQRPTGFTVTLTKGGIEYICYSGRAGNSTSCSTNLRGTVLTGFTPKLDVGDYTVSFTYGKNTLNVGTVSLLRRSRTDAEYALRNALPSRYATESRVLETDTILDNNAESARIETHSVMYELTRSVGQSLGTLFQSGALTRLTVDFAVSDTILHVESTLGFSDSGGVIVDGVELHYTLKTSVALLGVSRPSGQINTLTRGERVEHDPHVITD